MRWWRGQDLTAGGPSLRRSGRIADIYFRFSMAGRLALGVAACALTLGVVSPALADSRATVTTVLQSQLEMITQQKALNKCLAASPTRNTPCIRRNSLRLASMASRHIRMIEAVSDGTEAACVRTVARQQIGFLRIWRDGAQALYRNERKKARRLFVSSLKISNAQAKIQPQCFADILVGGG